MELESLQTHKLHLQFLFPESEGIFLIFPPLEKHIEEQRVFGVICSNFQKKN